MLLLRVQHVLASSKWQEIQFCNNPFLRNPIIQYLKKNIGRAIITVNNRNLPQLQL